MNGFGYPLGLGLSVSSSVDAKEDELLGMQSPEYISLLLR